MKLFEIEPLLILAVRVMFALILLAVILLLVELR
jgi:hypothetical protein